MLFRRVLPSFPDHPPTTHFHLLKVFYTPGDIFSQRPRDVICERREALDSGIPFTSGQASNSSRLRRDWPQKAHPGRVTSWQRGF